MHFWNWSPGPAHSPMGIVPATTVNCHRQLKLTLLRISCISSNKTNFMFQNVWKMCQEWFFKLDKFTRPTFRRFTGLHSTRGGSTTTGGGRRDHPQTAADQKNRDARPIKSRFCHPVSYSALLPISFTHCLLSDGYWILMWLFRVAIAELSELSAQPHVTYILPLVCCGSSQSVVQPLRSTWSSSIVIKFQTRSKRHLNSPVSV